MRGDECWEVEDEDEGGVAVHWSPEVEEISANSRLAWRGAGP